MLSSCQACQCYSEPTHTGDLTCAIAPVYASMCQSLQKMAETDRQALPIEACSHWAAKQPYDLDAGCIRRLEDGQWAFLNRIRKGWGETGHFYPSLSALLAKEQVQITGAHSDDAGTPSAAIAPAALGVPASQTCIFRHLVESSNLHAIGYDGGSETLYVECRNDTRYRYLQVPHPVYLSFLHAPSHGQSSINNHQTGQPCRDGASRLPTAVSPPQPRLRGLSSHDPENNTDVPA